MIATGSGADEPADGQPGDLVQHGQQEAGLPVGREGDKEDAGLFRVHLDNPGTLVVQGERVRRLNARGHPVHTRREGGAERKGSGTDPATRGRRHPERAVWPAIDRDGHRHRIGVRHPFHFDLSPYDFATLGRDREHQAPETQVVARVRQHVHREPDAELARDRCRGDRVAYSAVGDECDLTRTRLGGRADRAGHYRLRTVGRHPVQGVRVHRRHPAAHHEEARTVLGQGSRAYHRRVPDP